MKTPPLLLGAALLFWGWYTHVLALAVVMAIILEGAQVIRLRWELSFADFQRVAGASSLLLIGLLVYRFTSSTIFEVMFLSLEWFPIVLFPLLTAQIYSTNNAIDLRVLFVVWRPKRDPFEQGNPNMLNLTYPYVILCLLSASMVNVRTRPFYLGLVCLIIWALWGIRARRYSIVIWSGLIVLIVIGGYFGQRQLFEWQRSLEQSQRLLELLTGIQPQELDPYQTRTAIGDIGTVKLSNHALFRVKTETHVFPALLLREASYHLYRESGWYTPSRIQFAELTPELDRTTWNLQPDGDAVRRVTLSVPLKKGKGLLKAPTATVRLEHLLVGIIAANRLGALKVLAGPDLVTYQAVFTNQHGAIDLPPEELDLFLPQEEQPVITQIAQELALSSLLPGQAVQQVTTFFQEHFTYSLTLKKTSKRVSSLADFLLHTRSGHCEYFATATVLLLRAAGIPARYAVGYAVDGLTRPDTWVLVRGRDAHAWALAYLNGAWVDVDTTPAAWRPIEKEAASPLEWVSDLWAQAMFTLTEWRQKEITGQAIRGMMIVSLPILLVVAWRWYRQKQKKRTLPQKNSVPESKHYPGENSSFYQIIQRLGQAGFERSAWEPLSFWLLRLEHHPALQHLPSLRDMLALHYRYRFDPQGLTAEETLVLEQAVQHWLQHMEQSNDAQTLKTAFT